MMQNNTNNDNDNQVDRTNTANEIVETGKAIILLGMSTINVQETVKSYGGSNITDECLTTMARDCVIKQIICK